MKISRAILISIIIMLSYICWAEYRKPISILNGLDSYSHKVNDDEFLLKKKRITLKNITDYDDIVNRPLFFQDRKPYIFIKSEKPKAKVKKKKNTKPRKTKEYTLNAVIITPEKKLAILQSGKDKSLQRMSLGDNIDGWQIEHIEHHDIVLNKGSEIKELTLEVKGTKKPNKRPMLTKKIKR